MPVMESFDIFVATLQKPFDASRSIYVNEILEAANCKY